jgi:Fuc2NAc and GlcNAc transferase
MSIGLIVAVVFIAAFVLTWVLRRYALTSSLMDIPNERSSHSVPTPRGGGVAIVLSFILVLPMMSHCAMAAMAGRYRYCRRGCRSCGAWFFG